MGSNSEAIEQGLPGPAPEWAGAWMPQRHVEITAQIERLQEEARQIESLGRLLWQAGRPLEEAVRDAFRAIGAEAQLAPPKSPCDLTVDLRGDKRLLVSVASSESSLTNKSPQIRQVFEAAQDLEVSDRVVLVANVHRERPPADREWMDPATEEAMMVLKGLGVVFVTTPTLFRIWTVSKENPAAAAERIQALHGAPSGPVVLDVSSDGEEDPDAESPEGTGLADRLVSALKA